MTKIIGFCLAFAFFLTPVLSQTNEDNFYNPLYDAYHNVAVLSSAIMAEITVEKHCPNAKKSRADYKNADGQPYTKFTRYLLTPDSSSAISLDIEFDPNLYLITSVEYSHTKMKEKGRLGKSGQDLLELTWNFDQLSDPLLAVYYFLGGDADEALIEKTGQALKEYCKNSSYLELLYYYQDYPRNKRGKTYLLRCAQNAENVQECHADPDSSAPTNGESSVFKLSPPGSCTISGKYDNTFLYILLDNDNHPFDIYYHHTMYKSY